MEVPSLKEKVEGKKGDENWVEVNCGGMVVGIVWRIVEGREALAWYANIAYKDIKSVKICTICSACKFMIIDHVPEDDKDGTQTLIVSWTSEGMEMVVTTFGWIGGG